LLLESKRVGARICDHHQSGPLSLPDPVHGLFITFSPPSVARALKNFKMQDSGNYHYPEDVYQKLGYSIDGNTAYRPKSKWPIV
jgi:hypothetical protein